MSKVYVVGIGPGGEAYLTEEAKTAMERADILVGYTVYIRLIENLFPQKQTYTTPMKQEVARCRWALEAAQNGKTVALVCSGDAGVYGMAGLLLELAEEYPTIDIEIVAGVTAALSGAAVLGAPLGHDFCVISLSDLLTPWEMIEKRLRCAAEGDFAVCIYNPCSRKRVDTLKRACAILMETKSSDTVCGWVKNIGREGQESRILTLDKLPTEKLDMFTTVFIGSSSTRLCGQHMVTPRGYRKNEDSHI